ncbi:phosphotransferase family protein [Mycobacterium intracellulare]|uniref:phosphotransferase family protein n=1 Tax=Mycobacterium intracellulare TaxID=1767 RepID=UPI0003D1FE8A|nr:phosphotransferase family protein [Mycobacterium intracellulare]ETB17983.1 aminoglycoside phosphotransferase [Mycobacterium avium 09-5983]OCB17820.1 hypothetical protein A5689_23775 [Mycobacterium intracellulare subsp. yongonense]
MPSELAESLQSRLRSLFGGDPHVTALRRLTGGASRETWEFTSTSHGKPRQMILRRDPAPVPDSARMALEAAVCAAAREAGVPVPQIYDAVGGDSDGATTNGLGSAYIIMEKLDGETLPRRLLRDERFRAVRATLPYQLGRLLAQLHQVPTGQIIGLPDADPLDDLFVQYTETGPPVPVLELAFHWLKTHRHPAGRQSLVHGDFRNGNLIVTERGVAGVLDWELVHRGDPMEDLGWLCTKTWRFGSPEPVGGFGSREDLFRGYYDECGDRPDPAAVSWWEIYGTLRWAVMCRIQAQRHLSGQEFSVELLAIGRRLAECEHDLFLDLIGSPRGVEFDYQPDPLYGVDDIKCDGGLFGEATLGKLLAALSRHLVELAPHCSDEYRYHNRVAANVAKIVQREQIVGAKLAEAHTRQLVQLGFGNEHELALALRQQTVTTDDIKVVCAIRDAIQARILVANPSYR